MDSRLTGLVLVTVAILFLWLYNTGRLQAIVGLLYDPNFKGGVNVTQTAFEAPAPEQNSDNSENNALSLISAIGGFL